MASTVPELHHHSFCPPDQRVIYMYEQQITDKMKQKTLKHLRVDILDEFTNDLKWRSSNIWENVVLFSENTSEASMEVWQSAKISTPQ